MRFSSRARTGRDHKIVLEIYRESRTRTLPIRLLGIQISKLRLAEVQLSLFDTGDRRGDAVDHIRDRFGYHAVHLASSISRKHRR